MKLMLRMKAFVEVELQYQWVGWGARDSVWGGGQGMGYERLNTVRGLQKKSCLKNTPYSCKGTLTQATSVP